jgi:hypothetical protein
MPIKRHGKRRPRNSAGAPQAPKVPRPARSEHRFDEALSDLAAEVLAGQCHEMPWEHFRLSCLPGRTEQEAAAELGRWADYYRIKVDFASRAGERLIRFTA